MQPELVVTHTVLVWTDTEVHVLPVAAAAECDAEAAAMDLVRATGADPEYWQVLPGDASVVRHDVRMATTPD